MPLLAVAPWVAGCDEVGRGCLAGPVMAAAVCFPRPQRLEGLRDSKSLSKKQRNKFQLEICKHALWGIGMASAKEIDEINILQASLLAMHRALDRLARGSFKELVIDGTHFHAYHDLPHSCYVGGDNRYAVIAAASVLAKVRRDAYMCAAHARYPSYGWKNNKGYPTAEHRKAIAKEGLTVLHRRSYRY